jgi:hypothetical protein
MVLQNLYGRDEELAVLARLFERDGCAGRVLLLHGEPGIGKTALLEAAARLAAGAGVRVLRTTGVQAEAQLPFAGLHQLLRELLRDLPGIPAAEAEALGSVFGLAEAERPEPALINRGAALLLRGTARRQPIALLVDDVQWLDPQTREVVAFLAGRAPELGVLLIAAQRTDEPLLGKDPRWTRLALGTLADSTADLLLRRLALTPERRRQVLAEAAGNPLALRELAAEAGERHGPFPLTARLERAFGSRTADLPQPTRDLLLVAAADSSTELPEILAAAALLTGRTLDHRDLLPAIRSQLVHRKADGLHFRHPLIRSGILEAESLKRRQQAHRALSQVVREPYRHAWHRACAVVGPDDQAADLLADAAEEVLARGAVLSAVEALKRAAALTTSRARRGRRLLRAAELAFDLGLAEQVERLVAAAMRQGLDVLGRARGQWLRELFSDGVPGDATRVSELRTSAREAATAGDQDLALNLLLGAALRCWWADTGPDARAAVAAEADLLGERCPRTRADPRRLAVLAVAEPVLRGAAVHVELDGLRAEDLHDPAVLRLLGMAAHAVGHETRAADLLDRAEQLLREQGRVGLLAHVLGIQVGVRTVLGEWDAAEAAATEGLRLAGETGQPVWTTGTIVCRAQLRGLRGDAGQALTAAAQAEIPARAGRLNCLLSCVGLAQGLAWTDEGQDEDAYRAYRDLFDRTDSRYHARQCWDAVALFAEAAARTGHLSEGRAVLRDLELVARSTPAPLLHIQLPYARAVLAADSEAEPLYIAARNIDLDRWPWLAARLELAYGAWLRRTGRTGEAAVVLRTARIRLLDLGATAWIDHCERELAALT